MDKRKELLAAALKLFTEHGFHGTPTSKIAKEAGVANGTLFHYFSTKDELIVALYIDIKQRLSACSDSFVGKETTLKEKLRLAFTETIHWGLKNKAEFHFIEQFHTSPYYYMVSAAELEQQTKPVLLLFKQGIKEKIIKPLPEKFLLTIVSSHSFGLYRYLLAASLSKEKQKKIIADTFEMLWDMMT